jgi:hypothetical protein
LDRNFEAAEIGATKFVVKCYQWGGGGDSQMSSFEFFFGFYALILGLSVVEVVNGFARTLRVRSRIKLGYCTPLLALLILLDLIQFWGDTWASQQDIEISSAVLAVALASAAIYYFAATLVFPDRLEDWEVFDTYYDQQKRSIFVAIITANILGYFVLPFVAGQLDLTQLSLSSVFMAALPSISLLLPVVLICVLRDRRVNGALLGFLCLLYLGDLVLSAVAAQ